MNLAISCVQLLSAPPVDFVAVRRRRCIAGYCIFFISRVFIPFDNFCLIVGEVQGPEDGGCCAVEGTSCGFKVQKYFLRHVVISHKLAGAKGSLCN